MNETEIPLSEVPQGATCKVTKMNTQGIMRRRMLDLGLIDNTVVESLQKSPSGDPVAYLIRGAVIALRSDIASTIQVEVLPELNY